MALSFVIHEICVWKYSVIQCVILNYKWLTFLFSPFIVPFSISFSCFMCYSRYFSPTLFRRSSSWLSSFRSSPSWVVRFTDRRCNIWRLVVTARSVTRHILAAQSIYIYRGNISCCNRSPNRNVVCHVGGFPLLTYVGRSRLFWMVDVSSDIGNSVPIKRQNRRVGGPSLWLGEYFITGN